MLTGLLQGYWSALILRGGAVGEGTMEGEREDGEAEVVKLIVTEEW